MLHKPMADHPLSVALDRSESNRAMPSSGSIRCSTKWCWMGGRSSGIRIAASCVAQGTFERSASIKGQFSSTSCSMRLFRSSSDK